MPGDCRTQAHYKKKSARICVHGAPLKPLTRRPCRFCEQLWKLLPDRFMNVNAIVPMQKLLIHTHVIYNLRSLSSHISTLCCHSLTPHVVGIERLTFRRVEAFYSDNAHQIHKWWASRGPHETSRMRGSSQITCLINLSLQVTRLAAATANVVSGWIR